MRNWWQVHVEDQLNRLPVNWDGVFLYMWVAASLSTILSGGWQ